MCGSRRGRGGRTGGGCSECRFGFPLSAGRGHFGMTERLADLAGKPVPDVGIGPLLREDAGDGWRLLEQ